IVCTPLLVPGGLLSPHSYHPVVVDPLGLIAPFKVAVVVPIPDAALVVTLGGAAPPLRNSSTPSRMAIATSCLNPSLWSASLSGDWRSMKATSMSADGLVARRFSP